MWLFLLISLLLVENSSTHNNEIIIDYFLYKDVPSVVGFLCGDMKADVEFIKKLNDYGITAMIVKWNSGSNLNIILNNLYWKVGVCLDLSCRDTKEIISLFSEASRYGFFKDLNCWLILSENLEKSLQIVNDTSFSVLSDFTIAISKNNGFTFYDIYNRCKYRGGILNVTFTGTWNKNTGLNISLLKNKIKRRWNFHGMTLKMAGFIKYRPKEIKIGDYLQDYNTRTLDGMGKFCYALWLHVSDMFNFTIEPGELTEWKKNDKNGPLIAALHQKELDLAGTPATMTIERFNYVSCAATPWSFRSCFFFRTTESTKIKVNEFIRPLANECWYLIIFFIILSSVEFALFLIHENMENQLEKYSIAFLISIGSLCQQGSSSCPSKANCRIGFLTIMIFSLLMYNYYSASVVSARLNEPLDKMNDSLYSLAKSDLRIASEAQIYLDFFLKRNDSETKIFYKTKWLSTPESERFLLPDEGMQRVYEGRFAYHTEPNNAYPFIEKVFDNRKICELTEVHLVHLIDMALFLSKDSPFLENAKIGLAKLYETGIRQRQLKRWTARKPLCRKEMLEVESITIYETALALIVLTIGIILAVIICILENIVFFHFQNFEKRLKMKN